ncbi:MAG TPA: hypothetical protein VHU61_12970 [Solirubrobacteraceae bacterium]|jgi:hypothetical protein|nr:hypothetical protein [Solirubrobacteraceae bacterium]
MLAVLTGVLLIGTGTSLAARGGRAAPHAKLAATVKLPRAAAVPSGSPAHQAQVLAASVLRGRAAGVASLRTALKLAGIGILEPGGGALQKPDKPAAGAGADAADLALQVRLAAQTPQISLESLLQVLATAGHRPSADLTLGQQAVVHDLQAAAGSHARTLSFFANFVNDLQPSSSLLGYTGSGDFQLDSLQAYMLEQLWIGALGPSPHAKHRRLAGVASAGARSQPLASAASSGCTLDESAEQATEVAGSAFATASDMVRDWAGEGAEGAFGATGGENAGAVLGAINALLAEIKLADENSALKATIELENGEPLKRTTQTTGSGEQRVLKASLKFDFSNADLGGTANCLKLAAALMGVDLANESSGALKDAKVDWFVNRQGGDGGADAVDTPVEYYGLGGGSATSTSTNEEGETETGLEGTPQRYKLAQNPAQYNRTVVVGITVTPHKNNLGKDLPGLIGAGLSGSLLSAIAGTLDHSGLFTYTQAIQVQDWSPDYRVDFDSTIDINPLGGSGKVQLDYVAHALIAPPPPPATGLTSGSTSGSFATASGSLDGDGDTYTVTAASGAEFDVVSFDPGGGFTDPTLVLALHHPTESYHWCDPSAGECGDDTEALWLAGFSEFHNPDADGTVTLTLQPGSGDTPAYGSFTNSAPDGSATETTMINVVSVPPSSSQ